MKCQHCGNNLNIEDKFCPYCGEPNPYAVKHQKEMERFKKDYDETKRDVLEKSTRFNRRTVRITIIAVMIALIACCAFLLSQADDLRYLKLEKDIERNAAVHMANIDKLMEERDYVGVNAYFSENRLSFTDAFRKYDCISDSSMHYRMFRQELMILAAKKNDPERYKYYTEEELLENIAKYMHSVYEDMTPQGYNKDSFTEENIAYMEDLASEMETMVMGYLGVSEEDMKSIRTRSVSRINVLLEDSYEKE